MKDLLRENKKALIFLGTFIGLYLVLNTLYGFYVNAHRPDADPATLSVTHQTAALLRLFHDDVQAYPIEESEYVPLLLSGRIIVNVFEGCNSINVMIVFLAFMVAFRGPLKKWIYFSVAGLFIIYFMNLLRVALLFEVSLSFPEYLYFFHKFLFTGIIYAVVFLIWFFWIRYVGRGVAG